LSGAFDLGITIRRLAARMGKPYRTVFRKLHAAHAADRAKAKPGWVPWMWRHDGARYWRVNESRLRAEHAELLSVPTNEELDGRVTRLERQVEVLDTSHRALVRRVVGAGQ
jgi:hypothetical protein